MLLRLKQQMRLDKWILADDLPSGTDNPKQMADKLLARSERAAFDRNRRFEFALLWNRVDLARFVYFILHFADSSGRKHAITVFSAR
jgi:hypothetical protein